MVDLFRRSYLWLDHLIVRHSPACRADQRSWFPLPRPTQLEKEALQAEYQPELSMCGRCRGGFLSCT